MTNTNEIIPLESQARNYLIEEVEEPMSRSGKAYELTLYIDIHDGFGPRAFEHTGHSNRALCERFAQLFVKGVIAPQIEKRDYNPGVAKPGEPTFWLHSVDPIPHPRYDWSAKKFDALEYRASAKVETLPMECAECGRIHTNDELERTGGKCPRRGRAQKAVVLGDGNAAKEGDTAVLANVSGPLKGMKVRIDEVLRKKVCFEVLEGPQKGKLLTVDPRALTLAGK